MTVCRYDKGNGVSAESVSFQGVAPAQVIINEIRAARPRGVDSRPGADSDTGRQNANFGLERRVDQAERRPADGRTRRQDVAGPPAEND